MSRFQIRRRPDGVIQLRRRTAWRLVADPVAGVMLALLLGCTALIAGLVAALVVCPGAVEVTAPVVILGLWAGHEVHRDVVGARPVLDPPPRPRRAA